MTNKSPFWALLWISLLGRFIIEYVGIHTKILSLSIDAIFFSLMLFSLFLFFGGSTIINRFMLEKNYPLILFSLLLLVSAIASLVMPSEPNSVSYDSARGFFTILLNISIFLVIIFYSTKRTLKRLVIALFLGLSFVSINVLYEALIAGPIIAGIETQHYGIASYYRVGGLLGEKMWTGPLLTIFIMLLIVWLLLGKELKAYLFIASRKYLVIILLIISIFALLFSGSRSAILGLLIFISLLFIHISLKHKFLFLLILTFVIIFYTKIDSQGVARINMVFTPSYYLDQPNISTGSGRISMFYNIARTASFLGNGINSSGELDTGSVYAWLLFNCGWLGFFTFMLFLFYIFFKSYGIHKYGYIIRAVIAGLSILSMGEVIFFDSVRGLYVFSFIALVYRILSSLNNISQNRFIAFCKRTN